MADLLRHAPALLGPYPQAESRSRGGFAQGWRTLVAGGLCRERRDQQRVLAAVSGESARLKALSDVQIRAQVDALRVELTAGGLAGDTPLRAFALIVEAAARILSLRPYEVQVWGGWVLLQGGLAEMATGEGKTLTAALPAATAALAGIPVHVVTGNDYLASRDAELIGPLYEFLGLSVASVIGGMDDAAKRAAYRRDIAYCCGQQLPFDYLRDQMAQHTQSGLLSSRLRRMRHPEVEPLLRGLHFAIVDEADHVLIDEARVPLIIARELPANPADRADFETARQLALSLRAGVDFHIHPGGARLTELGRGKLEVRAEALGSDWRRERFRDLQVTQALTAEYLFVRDRHYVVREGRVEIVDAQTGRALPDRSWEQGLHQRIECKEGCEPTGGRETLARTTFQRFFCRYRRLSGMTGTAREVRRELASVYGLRVVAVPPRLPPRREVRPIRVFRTLEEKWSAIVQRVEALHSQRLPVLIGTSCVADSEHLAALLGARGLPHRVLNAKQDKTEAEIVAAAGQPGAITVATQMAGRGTDIRLAPGVVAAGGLQVILSERNDAGRIDRQLAGRCARQGDPGAVETLLSLEDRLMQRFYNPVFVKFVTANLGWLGNCGLLTKLIVTLPQALAEAEHATQRRQLIRQDERLANTIASLAPNTD